MTEKAMDRKLTRVSLIAGVCAGVFFIVIAGVLIYLFHVLQDASYVQMQRGVEEYKTRALKQIDKDFQTVRSLAALLDVSGSDAVDSVGQKLEAVNNANEFVVLAYFSTDGYGSMHELGSGTRSDVTLADCSDEAADAIARAFLGDEVVSDMFDSKFSDTKVYVYCVPVYHGGNIVGCFCAASHVEIFQDIISGNTVLGYSGYLHLIDGDGNFLVRHENDEYSKNHAEDIFSYGYLNSEQRQDVLNAISSSESLTGNFTYGGNDFCYFIEKLGVNDWYLFCVDKTWGTQSALFHVMLVVAAAFVVVLAIAFFVVYYGFRHIKRDTVRIRNLAYKDQLTGADNSFTFLNNYNERIKTERNFSLVALNLHNFKFINSLFGRAKGDNVLISIKGIIDEWLREGEFFCRESGDLFLIFILDTDEALINDRLERLCDSISALSGSSGANYEISPYCGVAVRGDIMKAQLAMQKLKDNFHLSVRFYDSELYMVQYKKSKIESRMHKALKNGEFKMYLQPKMELATGRLVGAEALVRWQTEDGSFIYPDEFIPIFESNGFCTQLDMYMARLVCAQIRRWIDAGVKPPHMSVNQSRLLFYEADYAERIRDILAEYDIPRNLVIVEVIEGLAVESISVISEKIEKLHEYGMLVSMDDFGSGYSSLNALYELGIDELKLDRAFLYEASMDGGERKKIILEQIVGLTKKLGISSVIEGVERKEDAEWMASLGCDIGQGYYYSRPIPVDEFCDRYMDGLGK